LLSNPIPNLRSSRRILRIAIPVPKQGLRLSAYQQNAAENARHAAPSPPLPPPAPAPAAMGRQSPHAAMSAGTDFLWSIASVVGTRWGFVPFML
jgi:hypothetical protein